MSKDKNLVEETLSLMKETKNTWVYSGECVVTMYLDKKTFSGTKTITVEVSENDK